MRNLSAFQPNGNTKAYYPLNGNSNDFSGNLNTGTPTNITFPQGRFGQGAKFNGSSSFISLGTSSTLNPSPNITVSCWVNRSNTNDHTFISRDTLAGVGTDRCYSLRANSNTLYFEVFSNAATSFISGATYLVPNRWYHLLATYDGTTIKGYVNGKLDVSKAFSITLFQAAVNTVIGKIGASTQYTNGLIDEVIIESRAWTAKEVETYYRKSTLNYRQKTFGQVVYTYISELLKGQYTLSGKQLNPLYNRIVQLAKGAYDLTGKQLSVAKAFTIQLGAGVFNLTGKMLRVPMRWVNESKSSSTWTNNTKNTSTMTNQSKSTSVWNNEPKA